MAEVDDLKDKINKLEKHIEMLEARLGNKGLPKNKDGLPIGIRIQADVDGVGVVWLTVQPTCYQLTHIDESPVYGGNKYKSLSAAAEFFSNIKRKSGWIYWRTEAGKTLKDAYKG